MKKFIITYLDTKYPNAFIMKTKFGNCPYCGNETIPLYKLSDELSYWFSCDEEFAKYVVDKWINSKPIINSNYLLKTF